MSNDQVDSWKNALINKGIFLFNKVDREEPRTIVVVGSARGGTSIIAGVLHSLGIFMGEARPPVFEDVSLATAFERKEYKAAEAIIEEYNSKHAIWAFKRPSCINYLPKIHARLRAPRYVFIFRDVLSIATRNSISMRADVINSMDAALNNYKKAIEFIRAYNPTAMLVSAEKLLADKHHFVTTLSEFIGHHPSESCIASAVQFIEPNSVRYLDNTRITKSVGAVDEITETSVSGWAKLVHSDQPPTIEIYVNNELLGEVLPDRCRNDQLKPGSTERAQSGFHFDLPKPLTSGDIVRVRVKHDVRDLYIHEFQ
jgi:hypothetical protein